MEEGTCEDIVKTETHTVYTHTQETKAEAHTPLVSLVQSPLPKPLSHRNQRARRGIKAVYIMKLKELLRAVSLTAPRKAFLLLQRIEERKKKGGEKKEENPPEQCSTTTAATTAKHTQKERYCENESEREAIERLFILSQPHVPTENVLK